MPKKPRRRNMTPTLTRIAKRALNVSQDALRAFQPTELDLAIAEALLSGAILQKDIADEVGVSPSTISERLKDPVVNAWISENVHSLIRYRLGLVDAAMFNRALTGDVRAAKLLMDRYGKLVQRSMNVTVSGKLDFDPSQLTDNELDALIASKKGSLDVRTERTEGQDSLPGGDDGAPDRGRRKEP